ncbi:MAG: D-2-hydroxyacid dehydrogenase [Clostridium sp.]|nr:D-2-hydroxyacid dehydrogenase [Clostridium sp.]
MKVSIKDCVKIKDINKIEVKKLILNMMPTKVFSKASADQMRDKVMTKIVDARSLDDVKEYLNDIEIVIPGWNVTSEDIDRLPNLKWIQSFSAGINTYPLAKIKERGIVLTNTTGIHGPQMAEHIMGMILSFSRGILPSIRLQKERKWRPELPVQELSQKEILIVGAGSIGAEVARKAKAFDMRVVGLKRTVEPLENFDLVESMDNLKRAVPTADFVVILAPLNKETRGLIGYEELSCMKKEGILINLARGPLVVEEDLIKILREEKIKGAGLDVFSREPLPEDNPLWDFEQVIITSHVGGFSDLSNERAIELISRNIILFEEGKELINQINIK